MHTCTHWELELKIHENKLFCYSSFLTELRVFVARSRCHLATLTTYRNHGFKETVFAVFVEEDNLQTALRKVTTIQGQH